MIEKLDQWAGWNHCFPRGESDPSKSLGRGETWLHYPFFFFLPWDWKNELTVGDHFAQERFQKRGGQLGPCEIDHLQRSASGEKQLEGLLPSWLLREFIIREVQVGQILTTPTNKGTKHSCEQREDVRKKEERRYKVELRQTLNRGGCVCKVQFLQGVGLRQPIGQWCDSLRPQVVIWEIQTYKGKKDVHPRSIAKLFLKRKRSIAQVRVLDVWRFFFNAVANPLIDC